MVPKSLNLTYRNSLVPERFFRGWHEYGKCCWRISRYPALYWWRADRFGTNLADHSPIDGVHLADISRGGKREVDLAVTAAKAAFPIWSQMSPQERGAILHRVADLVEARIEDLAIVETTDNGSLLRSHRRGVMPRVAMNFRFLQTTQ